MNNPFETVNIHEVKNITQRDIENLEEITKWYMCCLNRTTDSRLLKFIALYIILVGILTFCILMLATSDKCEDTTAYLSLLTLIIGVVIPTPQH